MNEDTYNKSDCNFVITFVLMIFGTFRISETIL